MSGLTPLLLAVAQLHSLPAAATEPPEIGLPVGAVELRLDEPLGRRIDLAPLIAIQPGTALTERAVRRTLQNLQATGLFSEIEVMTRRDPPIDSEPGDSEPGSTTVLVVLRAETWVSAVELRGERKLDDRTLLRQVAQKVASPLAEDRVLESVYALKDLYFERGYREATVRAEIEPRSGGRRVALVFVLDSGPRAKVGRLELEGDTGPYGPAELKVALRAVPGSKYGRGRIESDVSRLRSWLARRGHLKATIDMPREEYDPETHRMHLTYPISVGPRVEVGVAGASLRRLEKKGFLPFLKKETLDPPSLSRHCGRIVDFFQRQGHHYADVRCELEVLADGDERLMIEVERGDVYQLTAVGFEGNEQIADDELLPLMSTTPQSSWRPGSGRLVRESLDEDLENLLSYYLLQGFADAEIGTITTTEDRNRLTLVIEIREGERQRLVDFTFSGIELLDLDWVRASLPLVSGGPFHPVLLDDSINILRTLYEDRGFPSINITQHHDWNDDHTLVDVHLEVDEGRQAVVDRLILRGQRRSKTEVVRRFIRLEEGDPVSRRRLLEIERDLYRLGIFSKVDVEQRSAVESSEKRDVVVRLEEGQRYRLAYGLSYDSDDGLGGLLNFTRANIGGRGDRLQLDLRGNDKDSRYRLLYDQPLLWRWNVPITYSLFGNRQERTAYTVEKLGAQVALTKDLPSLRLRGVAEYRLVDILDETVDFSDLDPDDIEREDRDVEIFSWISIFYADRRDDPLDPQTGWTTALQLEWALPFLDAETNFLKLFWQQTHYIPLGRFGGLAASFRLGAIEPLDEEAELGPLVPPDLPSALVPVSERFFAGGRTSHRAYERDRLGILGETLFESGDEVFEAGGNGLAVLNLDYRFPIAGPVGGTVFFDYGNVWADWRGIDPDDFKPGAGLGVRYSSPIGPIRLEIGWKLDPEPQDDPDPVFFLSFGNPF